MFKLIAKIFSVGMMTSAITLSAMPAGMDWNKYFALTPDQKPKFEKANKDKSEKIKSLKDQEQNTTEVLRSQVDAKASDDQIKSTFSNITSAQKSIHSTEDDYWTNLGSVLTQAQQAKLFLKSHPPKNQPGVTPPQPSQTLPHAPPSVPVAQPTFGSNPPVDWKTYFALTQAQHKPFDDANKAKGQSIKQEREDEERAVELLRQKVDAQAPESEIGTAFAATRQAYHSQIQTEDSYWDTLAGILTPAQEAKLYLKGKPIHK